jgi:hypothetical protein
MALQKKWKKKTFRTLMNRGKRQQMRTAKTSAATKIWRQEDKARSLFRNGAAESNIKKTIFCILNICGQKVFGCRSNHHII